MIYYSYPIKESRKILSICLLALAFMLAACSDESNQIPPAIQLIEGEGYIPDSLTVPIGFPGKIGLQATKGDAAITNLVITLTTENGTETALDSGMYSKDFLFSFKISYGATRFEKWTFTLRDKNGKSAVTSLTLWKDSTSTFWPISFYPAVKLGTQNYMPDGSFFSFSDGSIFTTQNAEVNQSEINLITYWGDKVSPETGFTLSSPGESDVAAYFPFIANWSVPYNETRYKSDSLSISTEEFDRAYNDSLIISNYTSATVGKRKSKMVRQGYVIPFQVTVGELSGKKGLVKIISMQNEPDGYIVADIKVQK